MTARSKAWIIVLLIATAVFVAAVVVRLQDGRATYFASAEEHFKYGSIGTEYQDGVPYWIWQALPRVFADKLPGPGGYSSLGIVWEPERELPVGFSKRNVLGLPAVGINCAICHAASFRTTATVAPTVVAGGPAHQMDSQGYLRFILDCADDPRFTPDRLMAEIESMTDLSWLESLTYRYVVIPTARRLIKQRRLGESWMEKRPVWGRGRIDPFNPVKFRMLKLPLDETIGNSDMMSIWNMKSRDGMALHWDGLSTSLRDVVISSALGDGATPRSIDVASLDRIEEWILSRPAPAYPFPIDDRLAALGEPIFTRMCAECHAPGGKRTGTVVPVGEIGTDRHRLDMWTREAGETYNAFGDGYPWDMTRFRKTNGYVAVPLDGLWLRAPYLHNGSVPYLGEILERPENRTPVFYRGYDVYDPARVGFVASGPEAERAGSRYDIRQPGNSNAGHIYGTDLSADDKRALIEYLKTL